MPVWAFGLILPLFLAAIAWVTGDILMAIYASDGVGHIAHISGIAVGFFLGFMARDKDNNDRNKIKIPESKIRMWEERNM